MASTAGATREGSAKATIAEHISQAVQSTSNLLHLMQESSPSQVLLAKLPKNLLAKASTVKNTEQVLEQMPQIISSLDAYMDSGLHSVPHLNTVIQLLSNMENRQLNPVYQSCCSQEDIDIVNEHVELQAEESQWILNHAEGVVADHIFKEVSIVAAILSKFRMRACRKDLVGRL